jgi:hypothetical protein
MGEAARGVGVKVEKDAPPSHATTRLYGMKHTPRPAWFAGGMRALLNKSSHASYGNFRGPPLPSFRLLEERP